MLRDWDKLPEYMKTEEVRPYYDKLRKQKASLFLKRIFDVITASIVLIVISLVMILLAIAIAIDSRGGVFFKQERITQYGKKFRIIKFRTMIADADKRGSQVTVLNDVRVTRLGKLLRKSRLDELPQLLNIIAGDMSFVGTRPETPQFVKRYTPEMMATLLLPAGVTSEASIKYKDEGKLLVNAENIDDVYVNEVLPGKMKYNLESIKKFSFIGDIGIMIKTVFAVLKRNDKTPEEVIDNKESMKI